MGAVVDTVGMVVTADMAEDGKLLAAERWRLWALRIAQNDRPVAEMLSAFIECEMLCGPATPFG